MMGKSILQIQLLPPVPVRDDDKQNETVAVRAFPAVWCMHLGLIQCCCMLYHSSFQPLCLATDIPEGNAEQQKLLLLESLLEVLAHPEPWQCLVNRRQRQEDGQLFRLHYLAIICHPNELSDLCSQHRIYRYSLKVCRFCMNV